MDTSINCRIIDSEVRAYNNKLRRQKIVRRQRITLALVLGLIIAAAVILTTTLVLKAHSEDNDTLYKYYTQVEARPGDSLWGYAQKYASPLYYKDNEAYISEVRSINHLDEDYSVMAGELIILPYFSHEFK